MAKNSVSPEEAKERELELQKLALKVRGTLNVFEKKRKIFLQKFFRERKIVDYDEEGNGSPTAPSAIARSWLTMRRAAASPATSSTCASEASGEQRATRA